MTPARHDRVQGKITITNDTSEPVSGWQLTIVILNDYFQRAGPYPFHAYGDTLTVFAASGQDIAPGATVSEGFMAQGPSAAVQSCTFDGSSC